VYVLAPVASSISPADSAMLIMAFCPRRRTCESLGPECQDILLYLIDFRKVVPAGKTSPKPVMLNAERDSLSASYTPAKTWRPS
jgi:hypothetical protein